MAKIPAKFLTLHYGYAYYHILLSTIKLNCAVENREIEKCCES